MLSLGRFRPISLIARVHVVLSKASESIMRNIPRFKIDKLDNYKPLVYS